MMPSLQHHDVPHRNIYELHWTSRQAACRVQEGIICCEVFQVNVKTPKCLRRMSPPDRRQIEHQHQTSQPSHTI